MRKWGNDDNDNNEEMWKWENAEMIIMIIMRKWENEEMRKWENDHNDNNWKMRKWGNEKRLWWE